MRFFRFLVIGLILTGCHRPTVPDYEPESFREVLTRLTDEGRYRTATQYLQKADAKQQAEYDGTGYLAVAEDAIVLPGIRKDYEQSRDWLIPGTSDVRRADAQSRWQKAATEFAKAYNRERNRQ